MYGFQLSAGWECHLWLPVECRVGVSCWISSRVQGRSVMYGFRVGCRVGVSCMASSRVQGRSVMYGFQLSAGWECHVGFPVGCRVGVSCMASSRVHV